MPYTMSHANKANAGKELNNKEFKSSFVSTSKDSADEQQFVVFKAVCAMLNAEGGEVLIGVNNYGEPLQGEYSGVNGDMRRLKIKDTDTYARYIRNRIDDYFYDAKYVRGIVCVQEAEEYDNVIQIVVGKADRIVFMHRRGNNEHVAFRREGAASNPMDDAMINQRKSELRKEKAKIKEGLKIEEMRQLIQEAIDKKRKVTLHGYTSSNSNHKENRTVEPFEFICEGRSIWSYEEKNEDNDPLRQFRLDRIDYVEVLDEEISHQHLYKKPHVDAFEWTRATEPQIQITIMVGPAAKNYLVEECPTSKRDLTFNGDDQWMLATNVHSLQPVKRFCQQFMDTITVYAPDELKRELGLPVEEESKKDGDMTLTIKSLSILTRLRMAAALLMPRLHPHHVGAIADLHHVVR